MTDTNNETLRLAYEEATQMQPLLAGWSDALDAKVVAVFGVASALLALGPAFRDPTATFWGKLLLVLAGVCWLVAVVYCRKAYSPRCMTISPNPSVTKEPDWLHLTPDQYRRFRLDDMAEAYVTNRNQVMAKADALGIALHFTGIESVLLALALYAG